MVLSTGVKINHRVPVLVPHLLVLESQHVVILSLESRIWTFSWLVIGRDLMPESIEVVEFVFPTRSRGKSFNLAIQLITQTG